MSAPLGSAISPTWLAVCLAAYAVTALVAVAGEIRGVIALARRAEGGGRVTALRPLGFGLLCLTCALNAVVIGLLWVSLDRPPFKTLYETLLLYPFCIALVSIVLVRLHKLWLLVPCAAGGALLCLVYAWYRPDLELIVLPPALQSAWFVPHVVTYFIAYAGLFISFALALVSLVLASERTPVVRDALVADAPLPLEEAAHKAAIFGFVALTFGLAMGAAWGKSAWGDYWQWDPKENWAFITWLAYLCYLHLRLMANWRGRAALWVNLVCFAAVLFTYLGMHLLPASGGSLHVYQ